MEVPTENEGAQHMVDFPAISVTLEEIRRLFDMEDGRRQSLENKAGILVGVLGTIVTILSVFEPENIGEIIPFYLLLIAALLCGVLVFKPTKYRIPHKEYDDFYQYAGMDVQTAMDVFLLDYIQAAEYMQMKNNQKSTYLKISFMLTIVAWIYLLSWVMYTYLVVM